MRTFDTGRLHLRPISVDDEALYCHLYTDPQTMRNIGAPLSAEAALRNFHKACDLAAQPDPAIKLWIVVEKESGAGVGLLARVRQGDVRDMAEMGIMLMVGAQGRGFASEALGALIDRLFAQPDMDRLWTSQASGNLAVTRLMHRLGFARDDTGGTDSVVWRWSMARAGWQARRSVKPSMEM